MVHANSEFISAGLFDLALEDELMATAAGYRESTGMVIAERYVLESLLGTGGAASVWSACQTRPLRREVAIKIIRLELASALVAARFIHEYQVLARMEHPNIAAVFDAGDMPDGRTWFAMERVHGEAITAWSVKNNVALRERLEVFIQVCLAVQHAHQKGVLHRDLKPSNVMVTQVDGKPAVKVIDFGIAKALAEELSPGIDMTLTGMVLGTPRYMSPEQAGLTGLDVDTRTDVYALGVLLYELLTGTTPLLIKDEKNIPLQDLLHQVRHVETELPSRRVARMSAEGKLQARELQAELDWIAMYALQKDRERRYPTALSLADDIRHYLRDEPVSVGPPSAIYRLKKWTVRHRSSVLGAAAVFAALITGLTGTWWALGRAEAQRQETLREKASASHEADLARVVSSQLADLLINARRHVESGMDTRILRNLADEIADGMSRFRHQPRMEAQLAEQLGQLYSGLQEPGRSLPWFRRHWDLLKTTEGEQALVTVNALYTLGWRSIDSNMAASAVPLLRQAMHDYEMLPEKAHHWQANLARKELARALSRTGQHDEALRTMAEALQHQSQNDPVEVAVWLRDQADIFRSAGRYPEALTALRSALSLLPDDASHIGQRARILATLATTSSQSEHYEDALAASAERVKAIEREAGSGHPRLIHALISHVHQACQCPGCPGGEEAARRALGMAQAAGHESLLADAWTALSETLRITRRYAESEQTVREAIAAVSRTQAERWRVLELHRRLGDLLTARRDFGAALEQYQIAADEWFTCSPVGRAREKERLIFGSFIQFWELAADEGSPLSDRRQLHVWRARLAAWKAGQSKNAVTKVP